MWILTKGTRGAKRTSPRRTGFSMLEIIIYVALLSILLIALIDLSQVLRTTRAKFTSSTLVHNTAQRAVKTINLLVRNSDGLVEDTNGNECFHAQKLWLYFATSSASYVPDGCMGSYSTGAIGVEYDPSGRGVVLRCYQNYPSSGKASNCSIAPPAVATTTYDFLGSRDLFVDANGLQFTTTTAGSRKGVEANLTVGFRGSGFVAFTATTTASTTAIFRSVTTTAP